MKLSELIAEVKVKHACDCPEQPCAACERIYGRDVKQAKTPILSRLLGDGTIFISKGVYMGRAADGVVVQIGNVGDEQVAERYLTANPDPKDW